MHSTFDVYLTEEEWENPTLELLAQTIYRKRANPDESIADWNRERSEIRKGARITFALLNGFLALAPFVTAGSWTRRLWVTLGLLLFGNTMLLIVYRRSTRQFRSRVDHD